MYTILVEIDGSADSLAALNVAMAVKSLEPESTLKAQYVLDTPALWRFLGMQDPGLVGSGPYFQAFESIKIALRELAETVVESYQARCENLKCSADVIIEEGDWLSTVSERAQMLQPLVIVGKSTIVRFAKEANLTLDEISASISYPVVVVDKDLLSKACFPILANESFECGTELKLLIPATAHDLLARAESLSHAA